MFIFRILSFIVLFLSAIITPWPVAAGLAAVFFAIFPWFWEAIIVSFFLGVIYDFSSGPKLIFLFFVLSFCLALFAEEYLKSVIERGNILPRAIAAFLGAAIIFFFWLFLKLVL